MELDNSMGRLSFKETKEKLSSQNQTGCKVRVLGSKYWKGEYVIPFVSPHTLNHVAAQLFTQVGLVPEHCHFYNSKGKCIQKNKPVPRRALCIYGQGVLNLPQAFQVGVDDFSSAAAMEELTFQKYPPYQPTDAIDEITRNTLPHLNHYNFSDEL
jgi:hypothetical protein